MIGGLGEQFRLLIDGMAQLPTPFAYFVMFVQDAVHGANGTQIYALIEQAGVDFGRREINETRLAQNVQHGLAFIGVQRALRFWVWSRRPRWPFAAMQTGA